jgi:hypothetical protein
MKWGTASSPMPAEAVKRQSETRHWRMCGNRHRLPCTKADLSEQRSKAIAAEPELRYWIRLLDPRGLKIRSGREITNYARARIILKSR